MTMITLPQTIMIPQTIMVLIMIMSLCVSVVKMGKKKTLDTYHPGWTIAKITWIGFLLWWGGFWHMS